MSLPIEEEWRPVQGHEGYYVSNLGRIMSARRSTPKLLSPMRKKRHGYLSVNLRVAGRAKTRTMHSLVAEAFIGKRPPGLWVLHSDGNQLNNVVTNLRYGTPAENWQDSVRHGVIPLMSPTIAASGLCTRGHKLDSQVSDGRRRCLTCKRAAAARRRASQKAECHAAA